MLISVNLAQDLEVVSPVGTQLSVRLYQRLSRNQTAPNTRWSPVLIVAVVLGSAPAGGLVTEDTVSETLLTVTGKGGVPVMAKSWTRFGLEKTCPAPVVTIYCVVVGLSDWAGWSDSRLGSGPIESRSIVDDPPTISFLLRTQYWAPMNGPTNP